MKITGYSDSSTGSDQVSEKLPEKQKLRRTELMPQMPSVADFNSQIRSTSSDSENLETQQNYTLNKQLERAKHLERKLTMSLSRLDSTASHRPKLPTEPKPIWQQSRSEPAQPESDPIHHQPVQQIQHQKAQPKLFQMMHEQPRKHNNSNIAQIATMPLKEENIMAYELQTAKLTKLAHLPASGCTLAPVNNFRPGSAPTNSGTVENTGQNIPTPKEQSTNEPPVLPRGVKRDDYKEEVRFNPKSDDCVSRTISFASSKDFDGKAGSRMSLKSNSFKKKVRFGSFQEEFEFVGSPNELKAEDGLSLKRNTPAKA